MASVAIGICVTAITNAHAFYQNTTPRDFGRQIGVHTAFRPMFVYGNIG